MSWNNITPWWVLEMDAIVNELTSGEATYSEFVIMIEQSSIPEHNKKHLIEVWHPEWDEDKA